MERSSAARNRYWDEHDRGVTARRLLRTESEQRLMQPELMQGPPSAGRYYSLRPSATGMAALHHHAGGGHHQQQMAGMPPGGILRRRSLMESCSDTEVQSGRRPPSAMGYMGQQPPPQGVSARCRIGDR